MLSLLLVCCLGQAPELPDIERLRQEAVAYAEKQTPPEEGATIRFRVVGASPLPPHREGAIRFEPSHLSKREPTGRFFVALRVYDGARLLGTARVDLEGEWSGTVLTTRTALMRKTVPGPESVDAMPYQGTPPPGALTRWPEGYRIRQPVGSGKVLTRADIEPIPLVNAGDRVRVVLTWGPLSIATDGIARSQGALGDRVRVELPSRKSIQAQVDGEGSTRVEWQGPR